MLVLHVAEKPSIAETLARLLSKGRFDAQKKRVPVFEVRFPAQCAHPFLLNFPPVTVASSPPRLKAGLRCSA